MQLYNETGRTNCDFFYTNSLTSKDDTCDQEHQEILDLADIAE